MEVRVTVRVVGAGLGRTGTTSLKLALERLLGGPCYHMDEVRHHPSHPDAWASAYRGQMPDWSLMLDGYLACVDWPAAPLWAEISAAFPDALIVLSVRDTDDWWVSASSTIFPAMERAYFGPDAEDNGWTHMCVEMMNRFCSDWRDADAAKAAFERYNDEVRGSAPSDRLLVWKASDGWGPICDRLGIAVPDEPFPSVNTTAETRAAAGLDT
jgi:hypothetical protein